MNRRIIGLLATVCLASACSEKPVGQMEPIPRPPGMASAPEKAEAPAAKPTPAPAPPADPSKVVMRWKLDAPIAFRLTTTSSSAPEPAAKDKQPEPAAGERRRPPSSSCARPTPVNTPSPSPRRGRVARRTRAP